MKYTEFTSEAPTGGLKTLAAPHDVPTWSGVHIFHVYEPLLVPSILQTAEYRHATAQFWAEFIGIPHDMEEAAAITSARRSFLDDERRQFVFVLDERVLHHNLDDNLTMMSQIDQLYKDAQRPNVSIGVIARNPARALIPSSGFWIFDRSKVAVEIPNAMIEITDASQVYLYVEMMSCMSSLAQFDRDRW
jgi:Domain of unknown function (DUF5753)